MVSAFAAETNYRAAEYGLLREFHNKFMFSSLRNYLRGAYSELQKVTWPTKKEVQQYTVLVIIVSVALGLYMYGLDLGFEWLLARFIA